MLRRVQHWSWASSQLGYVQGVAVWTSSQPLCITSHVHIIHQSVPPEHSLIALFTWQNKPDLADPILSTRSQNSYQGAQATMTMTSTNGEQDL